MGESHGHRCGEELEALISDRLFELVALEPADTDMYRSLVEGGHNGTLDDGESATIAYAVGHDGLVLIDERKAQRICAARFPEQRLTSTVEVLFHPLVAKRLGQSSQSEAIFLALRDARMRVPGERIQEVIESIGADRAAECSSLPRAFRGKHTNHRDCRPLVSI